MYIYTHIHIYLYRPTSHRPSKRSKPREEKMDVGSDVDEVVRKDDLKKIIRKAKAGDLSAFQDAVVAYEAKHGEHLTDTKQGRLV